MKSLKLTTALLTAAAVLFGTATLVSAAGSSNCQAIYGGGEVCPTDVKFTIDKKVQKGTKGGEFVDNLSVNDEKFAPTQNVTFEITLKNTGSKDVTLNVIDTLPSYLSYVSGGTFDSNNKQVKNEITLKVGETKKVTIVAKVVDASSLPENQSIVCVTNVAKASDNSGTTAEDNAQLCIEKGKTTPVVQPTVPAKKIPETGPEALALLLLPPVGAAGLYLRRKAGL
ncbi:MAG: DUF11 domain-containing protein [Candidatus Levybacteria bacterium]|nr:DUF11 domain-containing protein [Candidatus Levybacteria bacterium]